MPLLKDVLHGMSYPIYAVESVGRGAVVVAGGGGAVKTGVPNRIDVVHIDKKLNSNAAFDIGGCPSAYIGGGVDTGGDAVMNLSVANSGDGSFVISLEGKQCTEYLARLSHFEENSKIEEPSDDIQTNHSGSDKSHVRRRGTSRQISASLTDVDGSIHHNDDNKTTSTASRQWQLMKLRSFTLPSPSETSASAPNSREGDGLPTCIANGGPGGCLLAVGSDVGSVFLFNRHSDEVDAEAAHQLKPFVVYSDVSGGFGSGVCSLAITSPFAPSNSKLHRQTTPLLATICDQPSRGTLRVWPTTPDAVPSESQHYSNRSRKQSSTRDKNHQNMDNHASPQPYAIGSCSVLSSKMNPPPSPTVPVSQDVSSSDTPSPRSAYHFKHCQFLKSTYDPRFGSENVLFSNSSPSQGSSDPQVYLLATTIQPLCANRKSVSRLVVWLVPDVSISHGQPNGSTNLLSSKPLMLSPLADISLPQGHLPACLCVHPSRYRSLIGVGTMDGRVEVYFLSQQNKTLTCVYSMNNAHPIFVTALTFLPPYPWSERKSNTASRCSVSEKEESFELISVSVDRAVRWHLGPSYGRIGRLAHHLHDYEGESFYGRYVVPCLTSLLYLTLICMLPLVLALLDALFSRLL